MTQPNIPIISIIVFFPLLSALALLFIKSRNGENDELLRKIALAASLIEFIVSLYILVFFDSKTASMQFVEHVFWVREMGLGYFVGIDGISLWLVILTTFFIPLCLLGSWTYIEKRVKEFLISMLFLETAMIGAFVALDLIVFYIFWEFMLIPMFLLIGIWGSQGKVKRDGPFGFVFRVFDIGGREYAAMKLTLMLLVGSAFILVAMFWLYFEAGGTSFDLDHLEQAHFTQGTQKWCFLML